MKVIIIKAGTRWIGSTFYLKNTVKETISDLESKAKEVIYNVEHKEKYEKKIKKQGRMSESNIHAILVLRRNRKNEGDLMLKYTVTKLFPEEARPLRMPVHRLRKFPKVPKI